MTTTLYDSKAPKSTKALARKLQRSGSALTVEEMLRTGLARPASLDKDAAYFAAIVAKKIVVTDAGNARLDVDFKTATGTKRPKPQRPPKTSPTNNGGGGSAGAPAKRRRRQRGNRKSKGKAADKRSAAPSAAAAAGTVGQPPSQGGGGAGGGGGGGGRPRPKQFEILSDEKNIGLPDRRIGTYRVVMRPEELIRLQQILLDRVSAEKAKSASGDVSKPTLRATQWFVNREQNTKSVQNLTTGNLAAVSMSANTYRALYNAMKRERMTAVAVFD